MGLSSWPDVWRDNERSGGGRKADMVDIEFADEMFVAVVTEKAIGLKEDEDSREVDYWIPISQIDGDVPERGEWIETITIPEWLASDLGLDS